MTIPVLRATLDVPFECAFTKAASMNSRPTYELPPVTTLQGMLYAALGRPSLLMQDHHSRRTMEKSTFDAERDFRDYVEDECRFGIRMVESGGIHNGLRNLHKQARSDDEREFLTYVTNVETLVSPRYRMYVTGPDDLLKEFEGALEDPERLLYLGRSDDMVDILDVDLTNADRRDESASLDCAIPGAGDDPTMLPVESDTKTGRRTQPSRVKTVAVKGGQVDAYYETPDGEQFVFLT
jgi:CRISPR-associated Cas5-like protein